MAKETSGFISDDRTYTHIQIGRAVGRSDRWAKEFIRENVPFADLGGGLLAISGRNWRLAIEEMSQKAH